ncbi:hypothetical protein [Halobaculum sp. D14]|uniref:hypothetical protein n=1 Tax=unclassified Halobaculum TaxID=2640896 RepID=UPI003EBC601C
MIRREVCWDAAVRAAFGAFTVVVAEAVGDWLAGAPLVGPLVDLAAVGAALVYGAFHVARGVWLVVEAAVREVEEGEPEDPLV